MLRLVLLWFISKKDDKNIDFQNSVKKINRYKKKIYARMSL